jgi:hypothetical protein
MKASAATKLALHRFLPHLQTSVSRAQQSPFFTLGLDVSSSFTGYTVLTPTGGVVRCSAIDLRKRLSLLDAATEVERQLRELRESVAAEAAYHFPAPVSARPGALMDVGSHHGEAVPWVVAIEDFLKSFGRASFHTQGLFKLAQLNGIVAYQSRHLFLEKQPVGGADSGGLIREPRMVMPNVIRAFHGLKASDGDSTQDKGARKKKSPSSRGETKEAPAANRCDDEGQERPRATTDADATAGDAAPSQKQKDIKVVVWERAAAELPAELVSECVSCCCCCRCCCCLNHQ